jgi:Putative Flp pilus-assembly TadE/G-like
MASSAGTDRGMVLVWAAVSLVVLLGMGALVIDVGALYQERREVQNGADAAALAVAKDCALDDCLDAYGTADHYADENAKDEASNVPLVCGEGPGLAPCSDPPPKTEGASGWVRVDTSTHNPDNDANDTQVDLVLAPVLDAANVGETVTASAVAAWAPLGSATTIPLTVSACEFTRFGGSIDPPSFPTDRDYIYLHDTTEAGTCPQRPPGADLPGGFGWLDVNDCASPITANRWVNDKPGSSVPPGCDAHDWRNAELVIPLFDRTRGLFGTDGEYHVAGFAGFKLLGYRFDGANGWNIPMCPDTGSGLAACIYGEFTRIIATDGEFGGGDDFGARTVKMIG